MVYTDIHMPLPGFISLDWSLMTLALVFIILRLSLRHRQIHPPSFSTNLSDFFIVLSWLSGIVLISINTWKNALREKYIHAPKSELYYGVPRDESAHLLYVSWISLFFIYISLWCSKAAFLAFYHSLFSLQGRTSRIILICASVFTFCTFLLHMLLLTLWCHPISGNWEIDGELCSAVHSIESVTISTFTNVATDIVILSIPLSALASMTLSKRDWSGLFFVFLMGSISIVAALARFVTLKLVEHVPRASITHTIDVWALVEIVASLLAVCLPSMRTFVRRHRPHSPERSGSEKSMANSTKQDDGSLRQNSLPRDSLVIGRHGGEAKTMQIEEMYIGSERGHMRDLSVGSSPIEERAEDAYGGIHRQSMV